MESEDDIPAHSGFSPASLCQSDLGQVHYDTQPIAGGSSASLGTARVWDSLRTEIAFVSLWTSHYPGNEAAQQTLKEP